MHSKSNIVLPLFYFGNIEYFYHLWKNDAVTFDLNEPFQKQTQRSRCTITTANGLMHLSVPVRRPNGKDTLMAEVEISNAENWRKDQLKALESAYRKSPYFEYYIDGIKKIVQTDFHYLYELNTALIVYLIERLGLSLEFDFSEQSIPIEEADLRAILGTKKDTGFSTYHYIQTFEERHGFQGNLCILDLLFNEGPNSITILSESRYKG